jgi:alpha-D-ribose 1-methylphosphonate 5-triphosphate synthase subunit PhnH
MTQLTSFPVYTSEEAQNRETFLALMWALSYPGRIYDLPAGAPNELSLFSQIGHALLDLETTYFTPNAALAPQLKHTAARAYPVETAAYHFYPSISEADLAYIGQAPIGTALFPDQSATLFIGCVSGTLRERGSDPLLTFQGPGIKGQQQVHVAGIPTALWSLRKQAVYPMGWDIFIVDPVGKVIGVPRTTKIEIGE